MKKMDLVKITILSAVLFELLIIIMTITPYGNIGNANQFGDVGMFYSIAMIALMYGIPLVFYRLRILAMKYILAVIIGICTIGTAFIFILLCLIPILNGGIVWVKIDRLSASDYFFSAIAGIICFSVIFNNVMWYMKAFSKQK